MARDHYDPNAQGLADIARSPAMQRAMLDIAEFGAAEMRRTSPVRQGNFRDAFSVQPIEDTVGWRGERRAAAAIINDDPGALAIERRSRTMRRAIEIIQRGA